MATVATTSPVAASKPESCGHRGLRPDGSVQLATVAIGDATETTPAIPMS
jgi:hypothetical protein